MNISRAKSIEDLISVTKVGNPYLAIIKYCKHRLTGDKDLIAAIASSIPVEVRADRKRRHINESRFLKLIKSSNEDELFYNIRTILKVIEKNIKLTEISPINLIKIVERVADNNGEHLRGKEPERELRNKTELVRIISMFYSSFGVRSNG